MDNANISFAVIVFEILSVICAIIESESAEQKRNEVTVTTWTKSVSLQFASVR